MIEGIPRISVYIISYNQENVIRRTLDSVIAQIDYVYEICVSDDHSTDSTWDILNEYSEKCPGLFKLNRNDPNLGIFENTEKVWTMPTGDIVYDLAGDDSVGEGWFKTVVEYIQKNKIDYKNELFCIYGDYKRVYPSGDVLIHKNDSITKNPDKAFRLALRQRLSGRSACYSINVLKKFEKVSQGRSHIAENIQDRQLQIYAEKNYYIPQVGNLYFSAIGISVHLTEEMKKERMQIWPYTIKKLDDLGITLNKKDTLYVKYCMEFQKILYYKKISAYLKALFYFIISSDPELKGFSNLPEDYLFALLRRLPHKRPIIFIN